MTTNPSNILKVASQLRTLCADPDNHPFILEDEMALGGIVNFLHNKDQGIRIIAAQAISFLASNSSNFEKLSHHEKLIEFLKNNASREDKSDFGKLILSCSIDLKVAPPALKSSSSSFGFSNGNKASFDSLFGTTNENSPFGGVGTTPFASSASFSTKPLGQTQLTAGLPASPSKSKNKTVYVKINGIKHDSDRSRVEKQFISLNGVISVSIDTTTNVAVIFGSVEEKDLCLAINSPDEYISRKSAQGKKITLAVRSQDLTGITASSMYGQPENSQSAMSVEEILQQEAAAQNGYHSLVAVDESSLQSRMRKKRIEKKNQESSRFFDKVARAIWTW